MTLESFYRVAFLLNVEDSREKMNLDNPAKEEKNESLPEVVHRRSLIKSEKTFCELESDGPVLQETHSHQNAQKTPLMKKGKLERI